MRYTTSNEFRETTRAKMANLFTAHLKLEAEAEKIRQNVKLNINDAFSDIDILKRSYVTEQDISEVLRSKGQYVTLQAIQGIMGRYDRNRDGRITEAEFRTEILPKSPVKLN